MRRMKGQKKYGKFKSYYVVWKLQIAVGAGTALAGFKSYYVVWKPSVIPGLNVFLTWFKSYYVVWKPKLVNYTPTHDYCLNRTM